MQITLNQLEIETALKAYINDQVNLKEGVSIVIDLKAGRGPEGFSANIDISAPGKSAQTATVAVKQTATVAEAVKPAKAAVAQASTAGVATGTAKVVAKAADPQPEPEQETVAETQEEVAEQKAEVVEAQAEAAEASAEEAAPVARPSLFGNLKKPVNS